MKDLTIIIPIKELKGDKDKEMLYRALNSTKGNDVIIIGPKSVLDNIKFHESYKVGLIYNDSNTDYTYQVNMAVSSVKTKYFSVLEYDDYFGEKWFDNVENYIKYDTNDIFAFLPLTEIVDYETNSTIGYANEAVWASSFSEETGYFDLKSMKDYLTFNTSGGIFNTYEFQKLGGLKNSMKLVFWLEFIKRALYNNKSIFVIPKIGYYHVVNRNGSMTSEYAETMSSKEAEWWIDLSEKEYFFKQDRNKIYEE